MSLPRKVITSLHVLGAYVTWVQRDRKRREGGKLLASTIACVHLKKSKRLLLSTCVFDTPKVGLNSSYGERVRLRRGGGEHDVRCSTTLSRRARAFMTSSVRPGFFGGVFFFCMLRSARVQHQTSRQAHLCFPQRVLYGVPPLVHISIASFCFNNLSWVASIELKKKKSHLPLRKPYRHPSALPQSPAKIPWRQPAPPRAYPRRRGRASRSIRA